METQEILIEAVKKIKYRDAVAMRYVYDLYVKEMISSALRITNNLAEAEDIVQDAFIQSFNKINQLKEPSKFGGWLKRIVINKCFAKSKQKHVLQPLSDHFDMDEIEEETPWYLGISFSEINDCIQDLPHGSREILCLYLLDEFKHKEIADIMSISVSTSKSQYRYGLRLLRQKLTKHYDTI